jgi:mono/diheme cytochrome c family protein
MFKYGIVSLLCLASFNIAAAERWFNQDVVDLGSSLFQQNCAVCHGVNAEGTKDWKKTDANGNYPPPPLNGSAHAWHHSIPQLARSIKEGGIKLGGVMPAFGDSFSRSGRTRYTRYGTTATCSNIQLCYDVISAGTKRQHYGAR